LLARGSRHRVILQTDGGLKTGRDVAMAAALGAQEYGFGTAALVAVGCVMARQCHLNSCPAGIATQKPELRAKYEGTPEQVIAYFRMVAEDVRRILASLGLRTLDELVGRVDLLRPRDSAAAMRLDLEAMLSPIGATEPLDGTFDPYGGPAGSHTLNGRLVAQAREYFPTGVVIRETVCNTDRAVGATLSGAIARQFGDTGLPHATIRIELTGSAGQSLGAFGVPGVDIAVTGDANDGVAKGLCGGTVSIAPPKDTALSTQVLIGNAALYGATGGRLFVAGRAGERFAVRNSGATAVVEGVGHHGCEYMTNGTVVVLGATGLNFAAGMTGGVAFAYDPDRALEGRLNTELVTIGGLSEEDDALVLQLLIDHRAVTDSALAARLLENWPDTVMAFCRVTPNTAGAVIAKRPVAAPARLRA
jgi:glutamate synthase domain-containing protein 3